MGFLAMRVLVAHSKYLSGDASGENRVVDDEVELLSEAGHDVTLWAPQPPVEGTFATNIGMGVSAVWAGGALRELRRTITRNRSEVVHFHNLFPLLSPGAIRCASDCEAAVVLTLHNYRYSCLPATFFRDGRPCEDCLGKVPWRGVVHRCYRNSVLGSASLATSLSAHRKGRTFDRVDLFIAISEFVRAKHVEAGLPEAKITVKSHFSKPFPARTEPGLYFLYLGRLSPEKGLDSLLPAWTPALGRWVVAGDGPERESLQAAAGAGVEFVGAVPAEDVPALMRQARAIVVPSKGYEGAGKVVMESYAARVPVVARRIGALAEVVDHGRTGLLVDRDEPEHWRDALLRIADDDLNMKMGTRAFEQWRTRFSPQIALPALEEAYEVAIRNRSSRVKS